MWENPTGDHDTVSELDCCVNVESFSITYVTEVLPQQQAKYSSRQGDKCAPPPSLSPLPPSLTHLGGGGDSLVLLLRRNSLSLWGLLTHIWCCTA